MWNFVCDFDTVEVRINDIECFLPTVSDHIYSVHEILMPLE